MSGRSPTGQHRGAGPASAWAIRSSDSVPTGPRESYETGSTLIKSEAFKFIVRGPPQELVVPLTVGVWVGLVTTAEVLPQPWPG
jgi:hypothetical protein